MAILFRYISVWAAISTTGLPAIHHRLAEGVSVLRINRRWGAARALLTVGLAIVLLWELTGYPNMANAAGLFNRGTSTQAEKSVSVQASNKASKSNKFASKSSSKISEVSPPPTLQTLRQELETYQPQVTILSPKVNEVLQDTTVSVQFQVKDLPLFKDETLGLGPHLHVFLDNQPYLAVYDANQPLIFKDLPPGTHTIRAFASRPWHESFKNEGAYAQTTFHIFAKTQENTPNPQLPLLTYSRPQASYGAEPIMLDFYLTNAPLHLVAQESSKDEIADWRIRCTINGDSFVLDRWQPIYLKGFRPGKNWVQLEYLDEQGNPASNAFNNTVRLINYEPGGKDTLSRLTRGDLSAADALGIVDPNYKPAPAPIQTPTPSLTPSPTPNPSVSPTLTPSVSPSPIVSPSPKPTIVPTLPPIPVPATPSPLPSPATTPTKPPVQEAVPTPKSTVKPEVLQSPDVTPVPQPAPGKPEPKNNPASKLFDRVRLPFGKSPAAAPKATPIATPSVTPTVTPTDLPKPTASIAPKTPATIVSPLQPKPTPEIEPLKTRAVPVMPQSQAPSPTKNVSPLPNATAVPKPDLPKSDLKTGLKSEPSPEPSPSQIETKQTPADPAPSPVSKSSPSKYLERYRRPIPSPTMPAPTPTPADSTPAASILPTP
jgi:hypothetical protein